MTSTSTSSGYSLQRNSSKVIQPPGGKTADIFGRSSYEQTPTTANNNDGLSRVHEADQQQAAYTSEAISPADCGLIQSQPQEHQQQQPEVLTADKPKVETAAGCVQQQASMETIRNNPRHNIPATRRNPITGEIISNQPNVVRVRQPPGGRSSGIF